MSDVTYSSALGQFWDDPFGSITMIIDGITNPPDASLGQDQVRAYGVDPSTGKLIPQKGGVRYVPPGYDPNNPMDFVRKVEADTEGQFIADQNRFASEIPLWPSLPDVPYLPGVSASTGILAVLILLVLGFFLIKAVK